MIKIEQQTPGIYELLLNIDSENAFSLTALESLQENLAKLKGKNDCKSLIIRSDAPIFSAGLNLSSLAGADTATLEKVVSLFFTNLTDIYTFPCPVIAAVNGHAMGYGAMIALASDFRFFHAKARIALPEVKIGVLVPGFIFELLADCCGRARAKQLIIEGRALKAEEAKSFSLADEVFADPAEALDASRKLAKSLIKNSITATAASKLAAIESSGLLDRIEADKKQTLAALATADAKEGIQAVIEKRRPVFA